MSKEKVNLNIQYTSGKAVRVKTFWHRNVHKLVPYNIIVNIKLSIFYVYN